MCPNDFDLHVMIAPIPLLVGGREAQTYRLHKSTPMLLAISGSFVARRDIICRPSSDRGKPPTLIVRH